MKTADFNVSRCLPRLWKHGSRFEFAILRVRAFLYIAHVRARKGIEICFHASTRHIHALNINGLRVEADLYRPSTASTKLRGEGIYAA